VAKADLRQSDFMFVEAPGFVDGIDDDGSWYIFPSSDWIL
jgi:serralysin